MKFIVRVRDGQGNSQWVEVSGAKDANDARKRANILGWTADGEVFEAGSSEASLIAESNNVFLLGNIRATDSFSVTGDTSNFDEVPLTTLEQLRATQNRTQDENSFGAFLNATGGQAEGQFGTAIKRQFGEG